MCLRRDWRSSSSSPPRTRPVLLCVRPCPLLRCGPRAHSRRLALHRRIRGCARSCAPSCTARRYRNGSPGRPAPSRITAPLLTNWSSVRLTCRHDPTPDSICDRSKPGAVTGSTSSSVARSRCSRCSAAFGSGDGDERGRGAVRLARAWWRRCSAARSRDGLDVVLGEVVGADADRAGGVGAEVPDAGVPFGGDAVRGDVSCAEDHLRGFGFADAEPDTVRELRAEV